MHTQPDTLCSVLFICHSRSSTTSNNNKEVMMMMISCVFFLHVIHFSFYLIHVRCWVCSKYREILCKVFFWGEICGSVSRKNRKSFTCSSLIALTFIFYGKNIYKFSHAKRDDVKVPSNIQLSLCRHTYTVKFV